MRKNKANKRYEPELIYIVVTSIAVFILALVVGKCLSESPIVSPFAINISASALTILFTVVFVERLQMKARKRNEAELGKIIKYQNYTQDLENDKQNTVGCLLEIINIMRIISAHYLTEGDLPINEKESYNGLLLDYMKLKVLMKCEALPRRPSFNDFATIRVGSDTEFSSITDMLTKLTNTFQEISKNILRKDINKDELFEYEAKLMGSVVDILGIVPRKFEDIRKDEDLWKIF